MRTRSRFAFYFLNDVRARSVCVCVCEHWALRAALKVERWSGRKNGRSYMRWHQFYSIPNKQMAIVETLYACAGVYVCVCERASVLFASGVSRLSIGICEFDSTCHFSLLRWETPKRVKREEEWVYDMIETRERWWYGQRGGYNWMVYGRIYTESSASVGWNLEKRIFHKR